MHISLPFLAFIFVFLKLSNIVSWSWWMVFAPIWILPLIAIMTIIIPLLVVGAGAIFVILLAAVASIFAN